MKKHVDFLVNSKMNLLLIVFKIIIFNIVKLKLNQINPT